MLMFVVEHKNMNESLYPRCTIVKSSCNVIGFIAASRNSRLAPDLHTSFTLDTIARGDAFYVAGSVQSTTSSCGGLSERRKHTPPILARERGVGGIHQSRIGPRPSVDPSQCPGVLDVQLRERPLRLTKALTSDDTGFRFSFRGSSTAAR